jgi:hypothetical protein
MDFRIEVEILDVTKGDIYDLVEWLNEQGPAFDVDNGDYSVRIFDRADSSRSWGQEVEAA